MDASVELFALAITAIIGVVLGILAFINFRNFQKRSNLLNRAGEMTGSVNGQISEVVKVERSNRSFRWKNEYPVVTYQVGDRTYKVKLEFAEKRSGHYRVGESCRVCYVPSDPSCSIVDEFRKQLQSSRTRAVVGAVILCLFVLNIIFSLIKELVLML